MKLPEPALWHDPETSQWKKLSKPARPTYEAYYTEAQLKQAVKDALEAAAQTLEELGYDSNRGDCIDAIRNMAKEIL